MLSGASALVRRRHSSSQATGSIPATGLLCAHTRSCKQNLLPQSASPAHPILGPLPRESLPGFPRQWVPPWSLHQKVLEVALKHRLLAPPPQLLEVCSGAENWHSDSSPGCRCWPWDLTLRTTALGGTSLSNLPMLYLSLVFPKLQPLAHPLPQALPTFLPSPCSSSYFLFLFVGSLWEFKEIYIKKGTFRTSWWSSG